MYTPPFKITSRILNLVAEISAKVERYALLLEQDTGLRLRTGRLWQSLILAQLHPLFAHLPVENMVFSNQQTYYDAITAATAAGESTPFIELMLGEILGALTNQEKTFVAFQQILVLIRTHEVINAKLLSSSTGVGERTIRTYLKQLSNAGIISYSGTTNNGRWSIILKEGGEL